MNKKMITIEELADGRVRVTVHGPQFVANGVNLSTHTAFTSWQTSRPTAKI